VTTQQPIDEFRRAGVQLAPGPDTRAEIPSTLDVEVLERQLEYIVDDCFFAVGQAVGMRTTVDFEAVVWWRDHYRAKFRAAMTAFGNRWLRDRSNVTSVAIMLAERAVRYAEGKPAIDLDAARQAAADVERHCQLHARRAARARGRASSDADSTRIAGYWCNF